MNHSFRKIAAFAATIATAIMPFANATPAFAAAPNWNTTGSYTLDFELASVHYVHDLSLTQTGASLAGNGGYPAGGPHTYTWVLTSGSVDGDTIDFLANYTASADAVTPQTTMHVVGTIAPNGTMSGTWSDNYQGGQRSGTWVSASGTAAPIAQTECHTMTLSSDTGTMYKGTTTVDPASSADGNFTGGTAAAVVAGPDGYPGAWDTAGNNPALSGASWVNDTSVAPTNVNGGQVDTWRLFGESFTLPLNATVNSASVSFSADNSAIAYYDNASIGSVADFSTVATAPFGATAGTHELEFVTKNFAFDGATNPTAIIYKATIEYCVPVAVTPPPFVAACPVGTTKAGSPLETVVVSSTQSTDTLTTNVLTNGASYILRASGVDDAGDGIVFDAKYSFRTPTSVSWTDSVSTYESYGPTLLDLLFNGTTPWGNFENSHTYEALVTGNGSQGHFLINDAYYPNNTGTMSVDIFACVPDVAPVAPQVHIFKFVDGVMATASNANNAVFPMVTTFTSSVYGYQPNVPFTLSSTGWGPTDVAYEASYVGGAAGDDYATNEVTGGSVVGASCTAGKPFALVGYTTGAMYNDAAGATPGITSPSFTNLQSDKYVIVWNKTCPQTGTISGMKFNDLNRNGKKDASEPGLPGWTIKLLLDEDGDDDSGDDTLIATAITDANGNYTFTNVAPGTYDVREKHQKGWKRQTKNPKDIVITGGSVVTGVDFGNAVTKKGEKEDNDNDDHRCDQRGKYFANHGKSNYSKESDDKSHDHDDGKQNKGRNH